jgi:hypothetical protein
MDESPDQLACISINPTYLEINDYISIM